MLASASLTLAFSNLSGSITGPEEHIDIRILQSMVSGITLISGIRTRMEDSYVYVVLAPYLWLFRFSVRDADQKRSGTSRMAPKLSLAHI